MDLNSTPFLSYSEINTEETDIYDDAWGFSSEFQDVISLLDDFEPGSCDLAAGRLISALSKTG